MRGSRERTTSEGADRENVPTSEGARLWQEPHETDSGLRKPTQNRATANETLIAGSHAVNMEAGKDRNTL